MPLIVKDLAVDQRFEFSQVDNVVAWFSPDEIVQDSVVKYIYPHAYVVKNEHEERKKRERAQRQWLDNIVKQKNLLLQNQAQLRLMVAKRNSSSSIAI